MVAKKVLDRSGGCYYASDSSWTFKDTLLHHPLGPIWTLCWDWGGIEKGVS